MKKEKRLYILFTILICLFSIFIVNKAMQNDTFSAIAIGKYILNHGLDFKEHFNITSNLSYHNARYLFNIIITLIYNNFGFNGIYIFVILITSLIGIVIFNIILKQNKKIYLSFYTTLFIMFISRGFFCARAQIVSYLLFILEIYFIEKLNSTNKKRYIIYILASSILIANIHTTVWPMTLVLFMPYFMEYVFSKINFLKNSKQLYTSNINIKLMLITFILTIFSGLATPLSLTPYTYMFKTAFGFSKEVIDELKISNLFTMYQFLIYTVIIIYLLVYKKVKIKVSDLFLIIGLYFMGALSNRNIAFLYLICYLSLSRIISELINQSDFIKLNKNTINLMIICVICPIYLSVFITFILNINKSYFDNTKYPIKATNYLLKHYDKKDIRLYNHFNFGSYLEYKGLKVFIDSRSEIYLKEFNDTNILKHWYAASNGKVDYNDVIKYYKITHVLVYNDEIINSYIKNDKKYKLIYSDDYFSLYKKND